MPNYSVPIWKEAPFLRLIIPLITGILIEWYIGLNVCVYEFLGVACFILIVVFSFLNSYRRFKNYWVSGVLINILLICIGGTAAYFKDVRHQSNCITRLPGADNNFVVTLTEPLSEKNNSFKTTASVGEIFPDDTIKEVQGNIIIYFKKDSSLQRLTYNSTLLFHKTLQPIKRSGNPGAFDYERYCIFQQVYSQVYLGPGDYTILANDGNHFLNNIFYKTRKGIATILSTYIRGKKEAGLAEALLIGYKDDLDKNLVQSYSNTGVVHIIAISGLHVGLIYWLLGLLMKPLKTKVKTRWIKAVVIVSGLWIFSILTGGSASVCRSALMFSFIVIGENIDRKTNVYNSLAASAFLLLCYNPYWLWDAGFQLSYIAVLSIIIFMKPIYNWFYIKNKLLDHLWKMAAISIAAQILTTPVSIFHFKQFPNYFLITNLVAVPVSSLVVLAEIALCGIAFIPTLATPCGNITYWLIRIMDDYIDYVNKMPLTVSDNLSLSLIQVIIIYIFILSLCIWIFQKNKFAFLYSMIAVCCLIFTKSYDSINISLQKKLVVYDVPHHIAIELINGRESLFIGDSLLYTDPSFQNFILRPSRNEYRIKRTKQLQAINNSLQEFQIKNKRVLVLNGNSILPALHVARQMDVIIISGNPTISLNDMQNNINCKEAIFDNSNSERNISRWKKECKEAGIECYSVAEKGAFILKLN